MTKYERNQAIYNCHKNELDQKTIGAIFSLSQSAISQIIKSMKNGAEPSSQERRGASSRLSPEPQEELSQYLRKPAQDYGYLTWNKHSIKALIQEKFEVAYHENYIYQVMRSIKFSSQKPQQKDYRQNAEQVAAFKEHKAVEIKKKLPKKIDV